MLDGRVFFRKQQFGDYVEVTRVARHTKPPALAAAVLRPGTRSPRWIDVNDLHSSLGHEHDAVLRETACQKATKVTGHLGYDDRCAEGKRIHKAVAMSTSCRAEKRQKRLCPDLAENMPASSGNAPYYLMIVDDATWAGRYFCWTGEWPPLPSASALSWWR